MPSPPSWIVKVGGSKLSDDDMALLHEASIDNAFHMADLAVLRFLDRDHKVIDDTKYDIGKELAIEATMSGQGQSLFKGEITAIEAEINGAERFTVVRGMDKTHRLRYGHKTRTFLQMSVADVFNKVAKECGLSAQSDVKNSTVHEYVLQHNQTNFDFLLGLAKQVGGVILSEDTAVKLTSLPDLSSAPSPGSPDNTPGAGQLVVGNNVLQLSCRINGAQSGASEAVVKGWDMKKKDAITGTATTPGELPAIGDTKKPAERANAFGQAKLTATSPLVVLSPNDAKDAAQALLNRSAAASVELFATIQGDPTLRAGKAVTLSEAGTRMDGKYMLTATRHSYDSEGYVTEVTASGHNDRSLGGLLYGASPSDAEEPAPPCAIAIVTDNNDPDDLGRVKVKFPWMAGTDGDIESFWARLAQPSAGNEHGIYFLPEVNDEVLVLFDRGDINQPVVVGGLWNGKDKPAAKVSDAVSGGKVNARVIRSRKGSILKFDDSDDKTGILLGDASGINPGKNHVVFDLKQNTITITADKDIVLKAPKGKIQLEAQDVEVKSSASTKVEASANLDLKGSAGASLKGAKVDVNGDAQVAVKGGVTQIG